MNTLTIGKYYRYNTKIKTQVIKILDVKFLGQDDNSLNHQWYTYVDMKTKEKGKWMMSASFISRTMTEINKEELVFELI
mgnify:CR=1 FL=1